MKTFLLIIIFSLLCFNGMPAHAQTFSMRDFLQTIEVYHPIAKKAALLNDAADAELLLAKGVFDPYIESEIAQKEYADKLYYRQWNSSLYIPVWGGIDAYIGHLKNSGDFLDPSETLPDEGLIKAGIKMDVLSGFWNNRRQIDIAQAKLMQDANANEFIIEMNELFHEAVQDYIHWSRSYAVMELQRSFIEKAQARYSNTVILFQQGDIPAIDTLEAFMQLQDRTAAFNESLVFYIYALNQVNAYLWDNNLNPLRLSETQIPEPLDSLNWLSTLPFNQNWAQHPKILDYEFKTNDLQFERKLKQQYLLPNLSLHYNVLNSPSNNILNELETSNYQFGLSFNYPLFLRQERAALQLVGIKLQEVQLDQINTLNTLKVKAEILEQELQTWDDQRKLLSSLRDNSSVLLNAEEMKFSLGESSLFLVNSRELSYLNNSMKSISADAKYLSTLLKKLNNTGNMYVLLKITP